MSNNIPCGKCINYHEILKPVKKGGTVSLHKGHCLIRTVYASNKPGNNVYPPKAKTAELPYGRHQIEMVCENEVRPNCSDAKERK